MLFKGSRQVVEFLARLLFYFHGAGDKPPPLAGNVFSKYFPWPYIRSMMLSVLSVKSLRSTLIRYCNQSAF